MNTLLKKVKNIQGEACVTIICSTHRTHPENEGDPLRLKNLVKNAEKRLYNDYEKRFVWPIMEKLNEVVDSIDHRENLESLLIFVNPEMIEYTRLAINVTDRVVIDDTFATRDLVRAEHEQEAYYTLVLSRNNARLIEGMNDKAVVEVKGNFPYQNETLYNTDKLERNTAGSDEKLIEEFFNRIDKEVQTAIKNHPLPVMIITDERNYTHYMKVADRKEMYMGYLNKNRGNENAKIHHIIDDVWPAVREINRKRNAERVEELGRAVGSGNFLSDINEIWKAIREGRGQTLFVKKGYFQPGLIAGDEIMLVDKFERNQKGICDDVVDEMIEHNLSFGGDTVFLSGDELKKFQNVALITRY
tara:strand:- start:936 stop:2012 length:1077 start_codon:yes stop_codon:yes gene_type:complete